MAVKPKRPLSAYMLWLNEERENIKKENPAFGMIEIAKKSSELWRGMKDKSEWEAKAAKMKDEYTKAIEEYEANGGGDADNEPKNKQAGTPAKKETSKEGSGGDERPSVKSIMAEKPKRPLTAYMLWLNVEREKIKKENPAIGMIEISKKAGELWRGMKDKSEWEAKAAKMKDEYTKAGDKRKTKETITPAKKAKKTESSEEESGGDESD